MRRALIAALVAAPLMLASFFASAQESDRIVTFSPEEARNMLLAGNCTLLGRLTLFETTTEAAITPLSKEEVQAGNALYDILREIGVDPEVALRIERLRGGSGASEDSRDSFES